MFNAFATAEPLLAIPGRPHGDLSDGFDYECYVAAAVTRPRLEFHVGARTRTTQGDELLTDNSPDVRRNAYLIPTLAVVVDVCS